MASLFENVLTRTYYGNTLWMWVLALACIMLSALAGKMLYFFSTRVLRRLTRRTKTKLDDILIDMIEEPVVLVGVALAVWFSLGLLKFSEGAQIWIERIFYVVVIFNVAWLIVRTLDALIEHYVVPIAQKTKTDLDDVLLPLARTSFKVVVYGLALIVGLNNAGYNVSAILAGLGIGGLAVAMAAKDTLANMLGGLTVLITRPFKVGDIIDIKGILENPSVVREIGLRSSRLEDFYYQYKITVPNSIFSDNAVINISEHPGYWVFLDIKLAYGTTAQKMDEAMALVNNVLTNHPDVDNEYFLRFGNFDDHSLVLSVFYNVKKFANRFETPTRVNLEFVRQFETAGVEFAYPFEFKGGLEDRRKLISSQSR